MVRRASWLLALTLAIVAAGAACGDDDGDSSEVTVFAAASLTDAFTQLGDAFHAANPDAGATFNFAGSQDLRVQLEQGAEADVFVSADTKQMDIAVESGVVAGQSSVFARNRLAVIIPEASEAGIAKLQDLANPGVKLVLANADAPAGNYARQFLDRAAADAAFGPGYKDAVLANIVSEESNVRQVAARVQLDEADAGIVYISDVTPELAADVITIDIPDELNQIARYPIALTSDPSEPDAAQAFINFVLSSEGQAILAAHGFMGAE